MKISLRQRGSETRRPQDEATGLSWMVTSGSPRVRGFPREFRGALIELAQSTARHHLPEVVVASSRCDSQGNCVLSDVVVLWEESSDGDDVDVMAEELLERHLRAHQVEQRSTLTELHQEVDVAVRRLIA